MADTLTTYVPNIGLPFQSIFLNHVLMNNGFTGSLAYMALFQVDESEEIIDDETTFSPPSVIMEQLTLSPQLELSGSGYSRVDVSGLWTIGSGSAVNNAEIRFPVATSNWDKIAFYGIYNNPTAGSLMLYGIFSSSFVIEQFTRFTFPIEGVKLSLTGAYSEYLSEKLLDHYLNNNSYSAPGDTYLALYLQTPNWEGNEGTEVSGSTGYARIKFTTACWTPAVYIPYNSAQELASWAGGSTTNIGLARYTDYATTDWGPFNGLAIWDHQSTGNMLYYGSIYPPIALITNDGFEFPPFSIKIEHSKTERIVET